MDRNISPILKWAGGKKRLIKQFIPLIPTDYLSYCEPFIGGGAVLFKLRPQIAYINDMNSGLINVYKTIKEYPEALIAELDTYKATHEFYYKIRALDRDSSFESLSNIKKAARFIYLNKTCYNGLYRENSKGQFNTPYDTSKKGNFFNKNTILEISKYFNESDIHFTSTDFEEVLNNLPNNTFVYLDPPYDGTYTDYTKYGFTKDDHVRLKECCDRLSLKNIKFMLSNSNTDFIRELYADYNIMEIQTRWLVNCKGEDRGKTTELIIMNY